jgi:hypothetical protein
VATGPLNMAAMSSATVPPMTVPQAFERPGMFPSGAGSASHLAPAETSSDRLSAAKGTLVAVVLSAGLWAAIVACVSILRH